MKKAARGRIKQRVMAPIECLARLAAMVPPPRYPRLRLHGVVATRHAGRARVVPRPPEAHAKRTKSSERKKNANSVADAEAVPAEPIERPGPAARTEAREGDAALVVTADARENQHVCRDGRGDSPRAKHPLPRARGATSSR